MRDLTVNTTARDRRRPVAAGHAGAAPRRSWRRVGRVVTDSRQVQPRQTCSGACRHAVRRRRVCRAKPSRAGPPAWSSASDTCSPGRAAGACKSTTRSDALHDLAAWNREPIRRPRGGRHRQRRQDHHAADDSCRAGRRNSTGTASPKNLQQPRGRAAEHAGDASRDDDFAVLELAASAAGEIGRLAALCQPHDRRDHAGRRRAPGRLRLARRRGRGQSRTAGRAAAPTAGRAGRRRRAAATTGRPRCAASVVWFGRSLDNDLVATHVESRDGQLDL